eukprot:m.47786 g.47786  ORF g.47786 m.47786 type:complete len:146 (+) comp5999_c0_seq3:74-511(+)
MSWLSSVFLLSHALLLTYAAGIDYDTYLAVKECYEIGACLCDVIGKCEPCSVAELKQDMEREEYGPCYAYGHKQLISCYLGNTTLVSYMECQRPSLTEPQKYYLFEVLSLMGTAAFVLLAQRRYNYLYDRVQQKLARQIAGPGVI